MYNCIIKLELDLYGCKAHYIIENDLLSYELTNKNKTIKKKFIEDFKNEIKAIVSLEDDRMLKKQGLPEKEYTSYGCVDIEIDYLHNCVRLIYNWEDFDFDKWHTCENIHDFEKIYNDRILKISNEIYRKYGIYSVKK